MLIISFRELIVRAAIIKSKLFAKKKDYLVK